MKFINDLKVTGILLLLVAGLGACDKPGPAETAGKNIDQTIDKAGQGISDAVDKVGETMSEQSNKTGIAIDDAEITARVKAVVFAAPGLDTLHISVATEQGVVTLSGLVDSRAHSDMADTLARAVSGVRQVNNRLAVQPD